MPQGGHHCNKVFGFANTAAVALDHSLASISLSAFRAVSTISWRSLSYLLDSIIYTDGSGNPS